MERVAQISLEPKQTAIEKPLNRLSQSSIMILLTTLAECRQATVSTETLEIYAKRLSCFPLSDVKAAIGRLSRIPRSEGETAFPALPDIEEEARYIGRTRALREAQRTRDLEQAREFSRILAERVADGESEEVFVARFPAMARLWEYYGRPAALPEPKRAVEVDLKARAAGQ